jgi:predicted nucleic-acid-binding protein
MMEKESSKGWLDTNVILRYLVRDNEELFQAVKPLFLRAEEGDISLYIHEITMAELVWTLESFFGYKKEEIVQVLTRLINAEGIEVPNKEIVRNALILYLDADVDYMDAYLASQAATSGIPTIFTLDKKHFSRLTDKAKFPAK